MLACANSVLTKHTFKKAAAIFFVLLQIFNYKFLNIEMKSFGLKHDFVLVALSQHLQEYLPSKTG